MRGALLLLEMTAVQLLLGLCLSRLLRPLTARQRRCHGRIHRGAGRCDADGAVAWKPGWWEEMPTVLYYVLAFLSGAMSAVRRMGGASAEIRLVGGSAAAARRPAGMAGRPAG